MISAKIYITVFLLTITASSSLPQYFGPFTQNDFSEMNSLTTDFKTFLNLKKGQFSKNKGFLKSVGKNIQSKFLGLNLCSACEWTTSKIHDFFYAKYGFTFLKDLIIIICEQFEDATVCHGAVDLWADIVVNNLIDGYINPNYICSGEYVCNNFDPLSADDFAKKVLADKPPKIEKKFQNSTKSIMLHITDVHADFKYKIGSAGICNQPLCCREKFGFPNETSLQAGKFGFPGECDIPKETITNFLDYAKENITPDLIIWTGDAPSHDIYISSKEEAIEVINYFTEEVTKRFKNIPVYPALGNHEFYPVDNFDYFNRSANAYTFDQSANTWKDWLGQEAYEQYRQWGFYAKKHVSNGKETNLKVIALNTMDCDSMNFNLLRNPTNPVNQLNWLREELYKSEKNGENVYIIGHIGTGDSTYSTPCSKRYNALIDRFENIIIGQFFGHTHYDEFKTIKGYFNKDEVVGIVLSAPSLTTYPQRFPEFRTFEIDSQTFLPIDYVQYYLNITEANSNPQINPKWEIVYRATEQLSIKSLQDFNGFKAYVEKLVQGNPEVCDKTIYTFFGMSVMYEQYKNKISVGKDLGCRFGNDNFAEVMKCLDYTSWNSSTERLNYIIQLASGEWWKNK